MKYRGHIIISLAADKIAATEARIAATMASGDGSTLLGDSAPVIIYAMGVRTEIYDREAKEGIIQAVLQSLHTRESAKRSHTADYNNPVEPPSKRTTKTKKDTTATVKLISSHLAVSKDDEKGGGFNKLNVKKNLESCKSEAAASHRVSSSTAASANTDGLSAKQQRRRRYRARKRAKEQELQRLQEFKKQERLKRMAEFKKEFRAAREILLKQEKQSPQSKAKAVVKTEKDVVVKVEPQD